MHELVVYVKPKGKNIICGNYTGPAAPSERIYVHCDPPIVGKRVKIKMMTKLRREVLVLCEVVVIGDAGMINLSQQNDNIFLLYMSINNTQEQYEGTPCMKFEFMIVCYGMIILFICHLFNLVSSVLDRFQGGREVTR